MTRPARSPALFYVVFFFTGTAVVMLSVLLARISTRASGDAPIGTLIAMQFLGQVLGSLPLMRRIHLSLAIGLGLIVIAGTSLGLLGGPSLMFIFLLGVGLGLVMASSNVIVGQQAAAARRGSALELLNVFWPVGAAICGPLTTWATQYAPLWSMYFLLAAVFALCLVWLVLTRPPDAIEAAVEAQPDIDSTWSYLALLSGIALLAVGVEVGISSWLPTFAARSGATPRMVAGIAAAFWCGSVFSRVCASILLRRIAVHRMATAAAVGTIVFSLLLVMFPAPVLLYLTGACAAFSIAPLYPAILTDCIYLKRKSIIFVSASLGSAFMPWAIGLASKSVDSLRMAMILPAAGAMVLFLLMKRAGMTADRKA